MLLIHKQVVKDEYVLPNLLPDWVIFIQLFYFICYFCHFSLLGLTQTAGCHTVPNLLFQTSSKFTFGHMIH